MPPDDFAASFPTVGFRRAIDALKENDLLRLLKKAEVISVRYGALLAAGDLLHEAVVRTLGGRRTFSTGVEVTAFLVMTMKSIASGEIEKRTRERDHVAACHESEHQPTRIDEAALDVAALMDGFERDGDEVAALVLDEWRSQKSGPEIMTSLGMDATTYNTTVRRIRRKAPTMLPERARRTE